MHAANEFSHDTFSAQEAAEECLMINETQISSDDRSDSGGVEKMP
jgi:hypothetical protein